MLVGCENKYGRSAFYAGAVPRALRTTSQPKPAGGEQAADACNWTSTGRREPPPHQRWRFAAAWRSATKSSATSSSRCSPDSLRCRLPPAAQPPAHLALAPPPSQPRLLVYASPLLTRGQPLAHDGDELAV